MKTQAGAILATFQTPWNKFAYAIEVGQRYLMENTTLGIPALVQTEGDFYCFMHISMSH